MIRERLFEMRDEGYKAFHCALMPTVAPETVIGVRVPELRKLAKSLRGTPEASAFLRELPHRYYEENNLHGLLVCALRDYEESVAELELFLPYVDNWATCDLLSPVSFQKRPPELPGQIRTWVLSERCYTVRFGLGMLTRFYLDEAFDPSFLELAAGLRSEEYYVNMMRAWYFATALVKRYGETLPYLTERSLDRWTHNKTIQKAVESRRITPAQKDFLRTLRWKETGDL